ncbi:unnamed protein product [Camellia sinensis]
MAQIHVLGGTVFASSSSSSYLYVHIYIHIYIYSHSLVVSVLNAAILLLFLKFYVKIHLRKRKVGDYDAIKNGDVNMDIVKDKDV